MRIKPNLILGFDIYEISCYHNSHMIIGPKKLLELVKKINLVENLSERELTNPEGAGFDLRIGNIYKISGGKAFLGIDERETPTMKELATFHPKKKKTFIFMPQEYYIVTTIEKVKLPHDVTINFKPRTTTFRSGLYVRSGNVAPGYFGALSFAVVNHGPIPVEVELGARIIHAQFYIVEGGGNKYRGQWQGGRVTTKKREKQV